MHKRLPLLSIFIVACYLVVMTIFFVSGMIAGPGRVYPDSSDEPTLDPDLLNATPHPAVNTPDTDNIVTVQMPEPVKVKGIYYNLWFPEDDALGHCIELIETTELNAIVIDVKDDSGLITFQTDNEMLAATSRELAIRFTDYESIHEMISDLKSRGIYTIARIVCFKDNRYANSNPSLAILNRNGEVWRDNADIRWLNPHNRGSWEYIAEICREAARIGFDEVQLDYVRFPLEGSLGTINYGEAAEEQVRYEIITDFVAYIREEMAKFGVWTSADIFGIVAMSYSDSRQVGHNVQNLLGNLDYICPMIYPSHFANSSNGSMGNGVGQTINGLLFERPDTQPYEVIYNSLQHFVRHIDEFSAENPGEEHAIVRPYLQNFTASYLREGYFVQYTPDVIKEQIRAVYDAGFDEWLLWANVNNYSAEIFS
ncbi:MAG: putative glycoside hydrolase [Oscillospiraceae bacterium]|nr:putative glycoside hydrolase [Oscillospiraceae bacterium]